MKSDKLDDERPSDQIDIKVDSVSHQQTEEEKMQEDLNKTSGGDPNMKTALFNAGHFQPKPIFDDPKTQMDRRGVTPSSAGTSHLDARGATLSTAEASHMDR